LETAPPSLSLEVASKGIMQKVMYINRISYGYDPYIYLTLALPIKVQGVSDA